MLSPGERIGCFEIIGLLGAGGMSQVFEARDLLLNRPVALKVARAGTPAGDILRKEAQALAAIRHPTMVTVHGVGLVRDIDYLVMERILGTSLEMFIERRHFQGQRFPVDEVITLLARIAEGLAVVHAAGIAHCDIKPANIMIAGGRVVLMDLGIFRAEFERPEARVTGTPHYMAPEVIDHRLEPGLWHLVDLYALGVIGYELLSGAPPFDGLDIDRIFDERASRDPCRIETLRTDCPPSLARLIHQLLARDPLDRGDSAEAARWHLDTIGREVARSARGPLRALVVDDDDDAIELLRAVLRRALPDIEVQTTRSSRAALDILERHPPDLMLLDVNLPEMSGIELCMYLRGAGVAGRCAIVMVSACADDGDARLLGRLGVHQFVRKGPGVADRLGAALHALYPAAYR